MAPGAIDQLGHRHYETAKYSPRSALPIGRDLELEDSVPEAVHQSTLDRCGTEIDCDDHRLEFSHHGWPVVMVAFALRRGPKTTGSNDGSEEKVSSGWIGRITCR